MADDFFSYVRHSHTHLLHTRLGSNNVHYLPVEIEAIVSKVVLPEGEKVRGWSEPYCK